MPRPDALLRGFWRLGGDDRILALEAAAALALACAVVRLLPGEWVVRWLRGHEGTKTVGHEGTKHWPTPKTFVPSWPTPLRAFVARAGSRGTTRRGWPGRRGRGLPAGRVLGMVERVARVHLLRPLCLEQALAGRWLLARHGHASTLVLGVRRPAFEAHAWLEIDARVGGVLTAGDGYQPIWRA